LIQVRGRCITKLAAEGRRLIDSSAFHPKIRQLYEYWQSIHPAEGLPGRQHFDPEAVPRLLSGLRLVEVQREPFRLRYRLVGSKIDRVIGHNFTGRWFDEVHQGDPNLPSLVDDYRIAVFERRPTWRRGPPRLGYDKRCATIEGIRLPLASDGRTVDMVTAMTVFFDLKGNEM
jgi:hypothetical protein